MSGGGVRGKGGGVNPMTFKYFITKNRVTKCNLEMWYIYMKLSELHQDCKIR